MEKYTYDYPHPAVATDCVVFGFDGKELKVLLIERGIEPFKGMWAFPGGFMRMDETAEECALRELKEETGLEIKSVKQLGAFTAVNRDPRERIVSIAFYSLAKHADVRGGDDAAKARWWTIDDVPQLAFDHDYILRQAMKRIRQDIHFEPVGFDLLGETFTIAELQRLYESILGVRFDRRNFYKKMLQTGILREEEDETESFTMATEPAFFGKGQEMRTRNIDELFAGQGFDASNTKREDTTERIKRIHELLRLRPETMVIEATENTQERHIGRKGKRFSFDKEGYERLKDNGGFKLEF
ncbi:MAG: NUDIX hydrolase [Bacteroidales bacterium]|nr:NUDIX hydrolase [Bacteroidales bacterium]